MSEIKFIVPRCFVCLDLYGWRWPNWDLPNYSASTQWLRKLNAAQIIPKEAGYAYERRQNGRPLP
jgi:hypothetical protein